MQLWWHIYFKNQKRKIVKMSVFLDVFLFNWDPIGIIHLVYSVAHFFFFEWHLPVRPLSRQNIILTLGKQENFISMNKKTKRIAVKIFRIIFWYVFFIYFNLHIWLS